MSACATTSPSEWPASPRGWSTSTPPSTSGIPVDEGVCVDSEPDPERHQPSGS